MINKEEGESRKLIRVQHPPTSGSIIGWRAIFKANDEILACVRLNTKNWNIYDITKDINHLEKAKTTQIILKPLFVSSND
jgi:hypothetical protein